MLFTIISMKQFSFCFCFVRKEITETPSSPPLSLPPLSLPSSLLTFTTPSSPPLSLPPLSLPSSLLTFTTPSSPPLSLPPLSLPSSLLTFTTPSSPPLSLPPLSLPSSLLTFTTPSSPPLSLPPLSLSGSRPELGDCSGPSRPPSFALSPIILGIFLLFPPPLFIILSIIFTVLPVLPLSSAYCFTIFSIACAITPLGFCAI